MNLSNYRIFSGTFGFTLAEVLITLLVIGIIATLTIPSLIQKTNDQEYKAALKRAYAELSNGVTKMVRDHGPVSQYLGVGLAFKPVFIQYFDIIRDCGTAGCATYANNPYKTFSGNEAGLSFMDDGQFVLKNGMTILINDESSPWECRSIFVSVDVNGYQKPPNVWGRDLFTFQVIGDTLKPLGVPDSLSCSVDGDFKNMSTYCSKTSGSIRNGISCGVYALSDKDY